MRERNVEKALRKAVEAAGGLCYKFTSPGHRGVPDRIVIMRGKVHFVELKAPGKKLRADQERERDAIVKAGGSHWLIDNTSMMQELHNSAASLDVWQRDCRTCLHFRSRLHCDSLIACDNASEYKATNMVRLWDRTV